MLMWLLPREPSLNALSLSMLLRCLDMHCAVAAGKRLHSSSAWMNPVLGFQADILCGEGWAYLSIDLICCLRWFHLPLPYLLHELRMQPLALLNLRQDQTKRIVLDRISIPVACYTIFQGFARAEACSDSKVRAGFWREEDPLSITCRSSS